MDRELAEEMREHLELKARQNIASGLPEDEAHYAARRQLGINTAVSAARIACGTNKSFADTKTC